MIEKKKFHKVAVENARSHGQSPGPQQQQKLKAERIQEELRTLPAWDLSANGKAVLSVRELLNPAGAAKFAGFVAELAAAQGQPVVLGVSDNRVFLTLPSRLGVGGLSLPVLDFARQLG